METEMRQRITLAQKVEIMHQKKLFEEYTYWDEAYTKIYLDHDNKWIEKYITTSLLGATNFDFSVAISQDTPIFLERREGPNNIDFDYLMNQGLAEMIILSKKKNSASRIVTGFTQLHNSVYFIIGAPLINDVSGAPRPGTYMAIGVEIDQPFLSSLAKNYQLPGLKLTSDLPEGRTIFQTVHSPYGEEIGILSVPFRSPSKSKLLILSLIILTFGTITVCIIALILRREDKRRGAYETTLMDQASTDPLTKLYNRRFFFKEAENEFARHKQLHQPFSVITLDIDHFKSINDTYGHSAGDKTLVHFSDVCRTCLRKSDLIGRTGGEEFAVILSNTTSQEALIVANSIRTQVISCPFLYNQVEIELTVSVGIATLSDQECLEALFESADKALYKAKNSGRNQVVTCEE